MEVMGSGTRGRASRMPLSLGLLIAFEVCDPKAALPPEFLKLGRTVAKVVGSDAHFPEGAHPESVPGRRSTWAKMGNPTLDGLRMALLEGTEVYGFVLMARPPERTPTPHPNAGSEASGLTTRGCPYAARTDNPSSSARGSRPSSAVGVPESSVVRFLRAGLDRGRDWDDIPSRPGGAKEDFERIHLEQGRQRDPSEHQSGHRVRARRSSAAGLLGRRQARGRRCFWSGTARARTAAEFTLSGSDFQPGPAQPDGR